MQAAPEEIQASYYVRTAARYDEMHTADLQDEHYTALQIIDSVSDLLGLRTFLDVGAGTGRAVLFLRREGRIVRGVEPVSSLIGQAVAKGLAEGDILCGSGQSLPFEDQSFDAVLECAVLHHVADPSVVVKEMMRVARKAVFLSDSNRFGQGGAMSRLLKLVLCKTGLWGPARYIQTGGKRYTISEGDGLAYSYSVYDSCKQLADWADTIWFLPTKCDPKPHSWLHPLLTSPEVLLCAMRTNARLSSGK